MSARTRPPSGSHLVEPARDLLVVLRVGDEGLEGLHVGRVRRPRVELADRVERRPAVLAAAGSGKYGWAPLNSVGELDAWTANATNMKTFEAFVSDPKNDKEISSWFDKM